MKKLLTAFILVLSLHAGAQKDTTLPELTDSTALIQPRDYERFLKVIVLELPAKYADPIREYWSRVLQYRMAEWAGRNKKSKSRK